VVVGVDPQRVALLAAVLEKIVGLGLGGQDIFLNVVGGLDVDEPAVDLGVLMAIASNFKGRALAQRTLILGEVGLNGEVRNVAGEVARIEEAARLGFKHVILPKKASSTVMPKGIELFRVANVGQALDLI